MFTTKAMLERQLTVAEMRISVLRDQLADARGLLREILRAGHKDEGGRLAMWLVLTDPRREIQPDANDA